MDNNEINYTDFIVRSTPHKVVAMLPDPYGTRSFILWHTRDRRRQNLCICHKFWHKNLLGFLDFHF